MSRCDTYSVAAFVLADAIPRLTHVIDPGTAAFQKAVALTLVALFVVGALRTTISDGWLAEEWS